MKRTFGLSAVAEGRPASSRSPSRILMQSVTRAGTRELRSLLRDLEVGLGPLPPVGPLGERLEGLLGDPFERLLDQRDQRPRPLGRVGVAREAAAGNHAA